MRSQGDFAVLLSLNPSRYSRTWLTILADYPETKPERGPTITPVGIASRSTPRRWPPAERRECGIEASVFAESLDRDRFRAVEPWDTPPTRGDQRARPRSRDRTMPRHRAVS